jgi:acetoin utilization protein AcuB
MNVTIDELMVKNVVSAQPHHTAGHLRSLIEKHGFHIIPIVGPDNEPVGVVSSSDLIRGDHKEGTPASSIMTKEPYCVNQYDGPHIAARVMRNRKIHHVLVTHEKSLVGIVSAFDLLKLVEEHRYVAKNAPTPSSKGKRD